MVSTMTAKFPSPKTQTKTPSASTTNKYLRILERMPSSERREYMLALKKYWPKLIEQYKRTVRTGVLVNELATIWKVMMIVSHLPALIYIMREAIGNQILVWQRVWTQVSWLENRQRKCTRKMAEHFSWDFHYRCNSNNSHSGNRSISSSSSMNAKRVIVYLYYHRSIAVSAVVYVFSLSLSMVVYVLIVV